MSRIESMVADLNAARRELDARKKLLEDITLEAWNPETGRAEKRWWLTLFRLGGRLTVRPLKTNALGGRPTQRAIGEGLEHLFGEFLTEQVRLAEVRVREAEAALTELEPR